MSWELAIYQRYCEEELRIGRIIKSPLRDVKSGKQFNVFYGKNNKLYWKDFGYESFYGSDVYAFVAEQEKVDRETAVEIVKGLRNDPLNPFVPERQGVSTKHVKYPIVFEQSDLDGVHYRYYESLFVFRDVLHRFNIRKCDAIRQGPVSLYQHMDSNFAFYWEFGKTGKKAYAPFNYWKGKRHSFYHKDMDTLEGLQYIDWTAKDLIITKAMKDVLTLVAAGYNAICVSGEAMLSKLLKLLPLFYYHFDRVIILADPDKAGQEMTWKIKKYFPGLWYSFCEIAKDPSDTVILTDSRYYIHKTIYDARPFY